MATEVLTVELEARTKNLDSKLKNTQKELYRLDAKVSSADKGLGNFSKTTNSASAASTKFNKNIAGVGRSAGQAGIQLQQFIGQIQGGQSAMLALSQQSADLGFVLGAPLLGAVAGISASIAGILLPELFKSEDAMTKLAEAVQFLDEVIEISDDGVVEYSQTIKELSRISEELAKSKVQLALVEAERAIREASKAAIKASKDFDGFFDDVSGGIAELDNLRKAAKDSGKTLSETLDQFGGTSAGRFKEINNLKDIVEEAAESFKISESQALDFLVALEKVQKNKTTESITELSTLVVSLASSLDKPNDKLIELSQQLTNTAEGANVAKRTIELLTSAVKDIDNINFNEVLDEGDGEDDKLNKRNERYLEAIQNRLKDEEQLLIDRYEKELEIVGDNNELKIALEEELLDNLSSIYEEYEKNRTEIEAEEIRRRAEIKEKAAKTEMSLQKSISNNAVSLIKSISKESKIGALAALAVQKAQALSANATATASGATLAYASQLVPGDPSSVARASVAAAKVKTLGAVNAGLIVATGLGEAAAIASSGDGSVGGGSSSSSPAESSQQVVNDSVSLDISDQSESVAQEFRIIMSTEDGDDFFNFLATGIKDRERRS